MRFKCHEVQSGKLPKGRITRVAYSPCGSRTNPLNSQNDLLGLRGTPTIRVIGRQHKSCSNDTQAFHHPAASIQVTIEQELQISLSIRRGNSLRQEW